MKLRFKYKAIVSMAIALCLLIAGFGSRSIRADESVEVRIPVYAYGGNCTAVLLDSNEELIQTLHLVSEETAYFTVLCPMLDNFTFYVMLTDEDTDEITYDHTIFTVTVYVYWGEDGNIHYTVQADPLGVLGGEDDGKPERIEFIIISTPDETPGPSETPVPSETPDPSATPNPSDTPDPSETPDPSAPPVTAPPTDPGNPQTGDNSGMDVWQRVAAISGGSLVLITIVAIVLNRKKNGEQNAA